MRAHGRLLIVAGSDSGGGAGIQADIKTCSALGGFAMTAVTALTAQNTEGVHGVHPVPPGFIADQMRVVLRDIGADAVKTGMLHDAEVIEAVAETLEREAPGVPVVVDPVMVAKGGHALLRADAVEALRRHMLPLAALLTPNLPEAEALLDGRAPDWPSWAALGVGAVLLKDGHGEGAIVSATGCSRLPARPCSSTNASTQGTLTALAARWPRPRRPALRRGSISFRPSGGRAISSMKRSVPLPASGGGMGRSTTSLQCEGSPEPRIGERQAHPAQPVEQPERDPEAVIAE